MLGNNKFVAAAMRYNRTKGDLLAEIDALRASGAVLLRHIYDSGIAYDNPEVEAALAVFAASDK